MLPNGHRLPRTAAPGLVLALALALLPLAASAQTAARGEDGVRSNVAFGARAGWTHWDPADQIHLGFHLKLAEVAPNIRLVPNVEAGLGDGATVITVNGDVVYDFTELVAQPWNFYGGPSLAFIAVNPDVGDSRTDLGLSAVAGLERTLASGHEALVELRIGLIDSPDFKLTFGYTLF